KVFKKLKIKPLWVGRDADLDKLAVKKALQAELVVDAILGTGFKPPLRGTAQTAIEVINGLPGWVLAVDTPSGVDADSTNAVAIHADAVVTFTTPKPAHVFGELTTGPMAVAEIGSPAKVVRAHRTLGYDVITSADVQAISRPRRPDSNKGDFGHVLVIGGSSGKAGAAAMVGMAALRAGAGLVTVACPKSIQPTIAAFAPELMTEPLAETTEGTISLLALADRENLWKGKNIVVIGPGLSRNAETAEFVRDAVSVCPVSLILDADGINAFEGYREELHPDAENPLLIRVLTPHPGEMARLAGLPTTDVQADRIGIARRIAAETGACIVLKGHRTVIASPQGHVWINPTGNPGMAKGGSGDVLAGIIAAVLPPKQERTIRWKATKAEAAEFKQAQEQLEIPESREDELRAASKISSKVLEAATLIAAVHVGKGVYLHGLAGDIAASLHGENSMIATDIINCLGEAFAICEEEAHSKFAYLQR
ncbi:MAG TPA: NAD(P)H-hydrate dehydratase, partial [Verrucomicrobiae bacterium]|nr:NAD(P)H-hydrate dehydratase [Verrucomicrobiae bacterium]